MDERERQEVVESYNQAKEKGVPFFPNALFKDAVVALLIFLILVALAFFVGAPLEAQADPSDSEYTPRPEWYFLFLFQLLKYFPGQLEVVGVFVIPTLAVLLLLALPFLDSSRRRHFTSRPVVTSAATLLAAGAVFLTVQALIEQPPPVGAAPGDQTAVLYSENCAPCHGAQVVVPEGTNLHDVIAQGKHEGMPAWNADLTSDEIDALAGFILSPAGSLLFVQYCGDCHQAAELVASDPLELRQVLSMGASYPAHQNQGVPDFDRLLSPESRTALLNFLVAPDGHRLFSVNCAPCHGQAVSVSIGGDELRTLISQGGLHLEMPPWRERLSDAELDQLAQFVVSPSTNLDTRPLFRQHCLACHGQRVPSVSDLDSARQIIASGGTHQTMPVWGEVLTDAQLDALVAYTIEAALGSPVSVGQQLYARNCASCHGNFGEGGPNPARANDIIAPISTSEYLRTRDDATLRAIIAEGQPNFGMSPFGSAYGGPLDDEDIDSIVAFMRAWEANPPVEFPPEVALRPLLLEGEQVYAELCAQCHGLNGDGPIGPSLRASDFQAARTDEEIFDAINLGHPASAMIGWGEVLTSEQIDQLVTYIRELGGRAPAATAGPVSFVSDVLPIFEAECVICHGNLGGWDGSTYQAVMTTGDNAPTVIPGDAEGSLLAQKLLGTQTQGAIMPPAGKLPASEIQIILQWIVEGAEDN